MKLRIRLVVALTLGLAGGLRGVVFADAETGFVAVAPCDLANHPHRYSGRHIRVEVEVVNPRYPFFHVIGCGQSDGIALSTGSEPPVEPQPTFDLIRDNEFKRLFDSMYVLIAPPTGGRPGRLIATVEGRFDSIRWGPLGWWQGYGHQRLFKRRLVLHRVVAVHAQTAALAQ